MATSSGASVGRFLLATLLAAALLAAMPAAASAASQRLSAERAIAIASSDPKVRPLLLANPGAHWEAVYDKGKDAWTVVLEPIGSHLVLATYRIDDDDGTIIKSDVSPPKSPPRLNSSTAEQLARRQPKLQDWIDLYPKVSASAALGDDRIWTVRFYDTDDNEVAEVKVDDNRMEVTDVRTGPQVGWMQARGLPDTYGRLVNRWWLLVPMSLLFIAGLMDWRRPLSLRTLDLLVLASFAISLRFFNHGEIFWATPLVYPPMLYLAARMTRIGFSSAPRRSPIGPTHTLILVAAIFALVGFRLGLNNQNSNILDVGYASVVGADRLIDGRAPWGSFPTSDGTAVRRLPVGRRPGGIRPAHVGALRVAGLDRWHLRPGGLRRVRPVRGDPRVERPVGRPAVGARRRIGLRPRRHPRSARRGLAAGVAQAGRA